MNLIVVAHCLLFDQNLNMTSNIVLRIHLFFAIWIRLNACTRGMQTTDPEEQATAAIARRAGAGF
jgi:hypothetical protein